MRYFFWSAKITAKNIAKKWLGKYGYRKYLQYFLRSKKITANICAIFCKAQKVLLKISQNKPKKNYSYRKYLRYFLRSAKITANICGIFCKTQKIPLKISQNKPKKTFGSYMVGGQNGTSTLDTSEWWEEEEDSWEEGPALSRGRTNFAALMAPPHLVCSEIDPPAHSCPAAQNTGQTCLFPTGEPGALMTLSFKDH